MKKLNLSLLIAFLLSSCAPAAIAIPTPVPTPTTTLVPISIAPISPSPTIMVTSTPFPLPNGITFQIGEGKVTQNDIDEISEAIGIIHTYFITNFGTDPALANPWTVAVIGVGATNHAPGDLEGQCCGHMYLGKPGLFFDVKHPTWVQGDNNMPGYPYVSQLHDVAHEYVHRWQNAQGCMSNPGGNATPMRQWLSEGMAEYLSAASLVNAGKLTWDQADNHWQMADARGAPYTQFPSLKTMEFDFQGWDYSFAYLAVERLVKQSPKGVLSLRDMCQDVAKGMNYSNAFQDAFGESVDAFYADFPVYAQNQLKLHFAVQQIDDSACKGSVSSGDFKIQCIGREIPDILNYGIRYQFKVSGFNLYDLPNKQLGVSSNCSLGGWGTDSPSILEVSIDPRNITQTCTLVFAPDGTGKTAQVTFKHVDTSSLPPDQVTFDNSFCADFTNSGDFHIECIGRNYIPDYHSEEYQFKLTDYDISNIRQDTVGFITSNCQLTWSISPPSTLVFDMKPAKLPIKCSVIISPSGSGKAAQFEFTHAP